MIRTLRVLRGILGMLVLTGSAVLPGPVGLVDVFSSASRETVSLETMEEMDVASWYGAWHHGRTTASGERFDMHALTAAHRSLPLGWCVEVRNLENGRRVYVRVNDRGPYVPGRTIDLSYRAARDLRMVRQGLAPVSIRRAIPEACVEEQRA